MTDRDPMAFGGIAKPVKMCDSIPAVIMKGEYWVPAATYARYRDLFKAMGYDVRPYPDNEGPSVQTLLDCAEDLAKNYEPSGAVSIVDEYKP